MTRSFSIPYTTTFINYEVSLSKRAYYFQGKLSDIVEKLFARFREAELRAKRALLLPGNNDKTCSATSLINISLYNFDFWFDRNRQAKISNIVIEPF